MIISVEELKKRVDCGNTDYMEDYLIADKLTAIEAVIRAYTNNNFQQREVRLVARADDEMYGRFHRVSGCPLSWFNEGDTVQISGSGVNDGVCQVTSVMSSENWFQFIEVDKQLCPTEYNLLTKVKYPADVIQCAVDLYKWKQNMGEKVGIKSETISRHSVTYEDSTTLFMGYPVGILNGLNLYKKVRC